MFSPNFDLILNLADLGASGRLALAGNRVVIAHPKRASVIRNDAGIARIRACLPSNTGERAFDDVDLAGVTVRMALGLPDKLPTSGTFALASRRPISAAPLVIGKRYIITHYQTPDTFLGAGAVTNQTGEIFIATATLFLVPDVWDFGSQLQEITADLFVTATAAEVQAALNATADITSRGGVTVTKPKTGAYKITFNGLGWQYPTGAQTSIIGQANNMTPRSVVVASTLQIGTSTLHEIDLIHLARLPYAIGTLGTPFPVAAAIIETVQAATASLPAIVRLKLDPMPYGGTVLVTLDGIGVEIPFDATEKQVTALVGANYIVARRATNAWEFTRSINNTAIVLTADVTNLLVPKGVTGLMPLNTDGMHEAFSETEAKTLRFTREVELKFPGQSAQKVYQDVLEVSRDIINPDLIVPVDATPPTAPTADYHSEITGFTGGGSSKLDGYPTVNPLLATGTLFRIIVSVAGTAIESGWRLTIGTDAESLAAGIVRPDDYNASTNARVWVLVSGTAI